MAAQVNNIVQGEVEQGKNLNLQDYGGVGPTEKEQGQG